MDDRISDMADRASIELAPRAHSSMGRHNGPPARCDAPRSAALQALCVLLLCLAFVSIVSSGASPAYAQEEAGEDDIFAEFDRASERSNDDEDDDEEELEEDYGFDDPDSVGFGVEELVVTGKASEGTAQSEAGAITAFDQSELDKMDISDVGALSLNTPSLHVGNFGAQPVITLRGVGAANLTTVGTPGVGFEMDGIHQGRPTAAAVRIYDVEDLRVYRGPQGIQGGYLTNGGRIAVASKRPDEELDVMGDFQYGSFDQLLVRGALNVPILPDGLLMSRVTITYENRDGYQENQLYNIRNLDADDADSLISRFQTRSLLFDESVEMRLIGGYNYQRGIGAARHTLNDRLEYADGILSLDPSLEPLTWAVERLRVEDCEVGTPEICRSSDPRVTFADEPGFQDSQQGNLTAHVNWDMPYFGESSWLSDMRVEAVGGYVRTDRASKIDVDGTNVPHSIFEQELVADQGSVELFLERPDIERFDFKIGGFYFHENVDSQQCIDAAAGVAAVDVYSDQQLANRSIAAYGDAGFRVLDNLRLSGGLRYSNEYKKVDQYNARYNENAPGGFPPSRENDTPCSIYYQTFLTRGNQTNYISLDSQTGEFSQSDDTTFEKVTYRAQAEWDVTGTSGLSFDFTTGYKPGGFTLGTNPGLVGRESRPYGAEEVTQYQLTSKNVLFDNHVQANLTLFWTDYEPFQVCQIIAAQFACDSNGNATSRGVELEVVGQIVDGLTFNGHFNFLDARVDNLYLRDPTFTFPELTQPNPSGGPFEDLSGNTLEKAPRFAGSFGLQYDWDLERFGILSPRAQMQSQSRTYYRTFNKEQFSQKPFAKLDLSLEWRSEDGVYIVRGFVNNVTDEDVINFLFIGPPTIGAPTLGFYLPPRTWGLRVGITTLPHWF